MVTKSQNCWTGVGWFGQLHDGHLRSSTEFCVFLPITHPEITLKVAGCALMTDSRRQLLYLSLLFARQRCVYLV